MTTFVILTDKQRRREILDAVPDEWKMLVAKNGATIAESQTFRCPWCELHVPMDAENLPSAVKKNEETT